jgi:hypothetical protein
MARRRVRTVKIKDIPEDKVWGPINGFPGTLPEQMGEADFQSTTELIASRYGWTVYHETDSRKSPKGLPDLIALSPVQADGSVVLAMIELKTKKNTPTLEQEVWLRKLAAVTTLVTGWVKPSDWPELLALFFDPSSAMTPEAVPTTPPTTASTTPVESPPTREEPAHDPPQEAPPQAS